MSKHFDPRTIRFPVPSQAMRQVSHGTASCAGHIVVEGHDGREVVVATESHEERVCFVCLAIDPTTVEMREQVRFVWIDEDKSQHVHWFDLIVRTTSGERIGYSVKPEARVTDELLDLTARIGAQAVARDVLDDVRVLTRADFDETTVWNAGYLLSIRRPDPIVDRAAVEVARQLTGSASLGDLCERVGFGDRSLHALLRLVRSGHLGILDGARLNRNAHVFLKEKV